jgi:NAD(P)-dependent dehydrogenase (short-subunit alcohol dehydrogenase family)
MITPAKTALVTGATGGLGKRVAARLAASGAAVLLHGRSEGKGRRTVEEIRGAFPGARMAFLRADLASLGEVRRLADEVKKAGPRLDLLVNNAGIGFGAPGAARELSRDGHELRFAVNYLAPFLLTHLLLPLLRRSAPARIVNVASVGQSEIAFDDLMLARGYDGMRAYGQSKLALVMLTFDLAEALEGSGVTANALHPATLMDTRMVAEAGFAPRSSVEEGADAVLALAASRRLEGVSGAFFDGTRPARAYRQAYDPDARARLRELSRRLADLPG